MTKMTDRNRQRYVVVGDVQHDKHSWTENYVYCRAYKRLQLSATRRQAFHTRLCDVFVA